MAALALWLVVSVWGFAGDGYADWLLFVVTTFIFIVVTLLFVLSRVRRPHDSETVHEDPFFHWASGDFITWQDRLKGRNAAIEVLLPLAAVAFGMSAFAVAYHIALGGAA
jgi:hypothetical protein